jgi:hypothetical protein
MITTSTPRRLVAAAVVITATGFGVIRLTTAGAATATTAVVAAAGSTTPFISLEAEAGTLGGGATAVALTAPPTTQFSSPTLEASGHAYVELTGTGQSVRWTNTTGQPISAINVRLSVPDAPAGGGITTGLNLYVDGAFRQTLTATSTQTWVYEGNNHYNDSRNQNPADGNPRVFYDETHAFVTGTPIPPGATFALQKDAANRAAFYWVDVIDAENPPGPLPQPADSIAITSCGAVSSASVDSTAAIQNCIGQAQAQNRTLWIPAGTFYLKGTANLRATGITIAGAGMWHSTIYRAVPLPNPQPLGAVFDVTSCRVQNFRIDSNATGRDVQFGMGGAMDTTGTDWVADGIWTQHTLSGFWASGTGGTIRNTRLTTIWGDGINVNNVALGNSVGADLTVTNNFVRGTGDDAIAINSVAYNTNSDGTQTRYTPMSQVTIRNNTSVAMWGGKGVSVYGGSGHVVADNYIADSARYIGLGVGKFGVNGNDLLGATVTGNTVVRAGGNAYSQGQPALHIGNGGDGQSVGIVEGVTVADNTVIDAVYDGAGFSTTTGAVLRNNTITAPWRNGIVVAPPFYPAPSGSAAVTGNTVTGLRSGMSPFLNNSGGFTATVTGNSWQ